MLYGNSRSGDKIKYVLGECEKNNCKEMLDNSINVFYLSKKYGRIFVSIDNESGYLKK